MKDELYSKTNNSSHDVTKSEIIYNLHLKQKNQKSYWILSFKKINKIDKKANLNKNFNLENLTILRPLY